MKVCGITGIACFLLSCGGSPPAPPATPDLAVGSSPTPGAAPTVAKPVGRGPSAEVAKYWGLSGDLKGWVYVDAEGLEKTELFRSISQSIFAASSEIDPCIKEVVLGMREILVGVDAREGGFAVIRTDPAVKVAPCIEKQSASKLEKRTIEGAESAFAERDMLIALNPGILVAGDPDLVKPALAGRSQPLPAEIALAKDEYVVGRFGDRKQKISVRGSLVAAPERFRAELVADVPEPLAGMAESQFARAGGDPAFGEIARTFTLRRDGGHLVVAIEIAGPPQKQAKELGNLAALATSGVRKYISKSKQAEVKNVIGQIAKDLVTNWEIETGKPRAQRKLVSFPAVPKTVPKGTKYQSEEKDWDAWKPLKFSMVSPQYFQYEVKAAKDGESAEVIGRGDLNGDGKTSTFKVLLKIDRKTQTLQISPSISEDNPDE